MNSKIQIEDLVDGYTKRVTIDIDGLDFVRLKPSNTERIAKETYNKTKKISDMLWYLSELFEGFEELEAQQTLEGFEE